MTVLHRVIYEEAPREVRVDFTKAHRSQWTSLFALVRPDIRYCGATEVLAFVFGGCDDATVVAGDHDQRRCVPWSPEPGMGCGLESDGDLFRYGLKRPDCSTLVDGSRHAIEDVRWTYE